MRTLARPSTLSPAAITRFSTSAFVLAAIASAYSQQC